MIQPTQNYRVYQDARGKWIIQNTFTDTIVCYNFKTKSDAEGHTRLITQPNK